MENQASAAKQTVVIGGSLGGLFAGLLLRSIRWDVDVYERSPHDLDSRGGGIVLQPEVLEALRRAGVQYDSSIGVEAKERVFLDRSGGLARRLPMRQMLTSCTSLYGAMRRHFPAEPQLCPACRGLWQHLATPKLRHAYLSSPFHGHKADP